MSLEQFTTDFFPLVRKTARGIIRNYSGWFNDPREELNDLISAGMLELVSIFERVDFSNPGYKGFVSVRVRGCLLNYVYKNIPNTDHDGGSCGVDDGSEGPIRSPHFSRQVPIDDVMETACEMEDELDIESLLFRHQVLSLLDEFMESLDPKERFMLVARFHDERTYEEIGLIVHMRRETVSGKINDIVTRLGKFFRRKCSWRLEPADIAEYLQETDLAVCLKETGRGMLILSGREDSPSATQRGTRK